MSTETQRAPVPQDNSNTGQSPSLRSFATWSVVLIMAGVSLFAVFLLLRAFFRNDGLYTTLLAEHVRGIVGVPMAAASAFCVLLVLEARGGPIEFEALGFRFRGASGPAVIWIFAFLSFAGVIRMLW